MNSQKEISSARATRKAGIFIALASGVLVFASLVSLMHDYAQHEGHISLLILASDIFMNTQGPVLTDIWNIAAYPIYLDLFGSGSLGFAAEVVGLVLGVYLAISATLKLKRIANGRHSLKEPLQP